MKKNYFLQPHFSNGPELYSVTCRYDNIILYCLAGARDTILQATFAADKHKRLQKSLQQSYPDIRLGKLSQEEFFCNTMFAEYFSGERKTFPADLQSPLLAMGTAFQQRIWQQIRVIPYGSTITYQQLAERAGSPKGFRAAGLACGANPLGLIIPCHRVVAANGPGGFAGGLQVKKYLLEHERCRRRVNGGVQGAP